MKGPYKEVIAMFILKKLTSTDQRVSIPLQWILSALLVQESVYICNMGFKDEQRKKELLVFAEAVDNEDADVGECQEYNFELKIDDQLPLTDFPW